MSAHSNKNETMSLGHVNELLRTLSKKTHAAFREQNFKEAQHLLHDVLKIAPYHKTAWMDLASATLRLGEHE